MTINEISEYKITDSMSVLDFANLFTFNIIKLNKQVNGFIKYLLRENADYTEKKEHSAIVHCPIKRKWIFERLNTNNEQIVIEWEKKYKEVKKNKILFGVLLEYYDEQRSGLIEKVLSRDFNVKLLSALFDYDINFGELGTDYGMRVLSGVVHRHQKSGEFYRPTHFHYVLECSLDKESDKFKELEEIVC